MIIDRLLEKNCCLHDILEAVRPHLDLSFETILAHINTIFVLATKQGMGTTMHHERYLRLKVSEACNTMNFVGIKLSAEYRRTSVIGRSPTSAGQGQFVLKWRKLDCSCWFQLFKFVTRVLVLLFITHLYTGGWTHVNLSLVPHNSRDKCSTWRSLT